VKHHLFFFLIERAAVAQEKVGTETPVSRGRPFQGRCASCTNVRSVGLCDCVVQHVLSIIASPPLHCHRLFSSRSPVEQLSLFTVPRSVTIDRAVIRFALCFVLPACLLACACACVCLPFSLCCLCELCSSVLSLCVVCVSRSRKHSSFLSRSFFHPPMRCDVVLLSGDEC
jgi:hypothetical protein